MTRLKFDLTPAGEFTDITPSIEENIPEDFTGMCFVYSPHTTGCIRIMENETLLMKDLHDFMERIASSNCLYRHDNIEERSVPPDERRNGFSHLRAMLLNQSEIVPVWKGKMELGTWQRIFFIECDPHPIRDRQFFVYLTRG